MSQYPIAILEGRNVIWGLVTIGFFCHDICIGLELQTPATRCLVKRRAKRESFKKSCIHSSHILNTRRIKEGRTMT